MRALNGLCLVLLLTGSALADPMNLAGGALITHYVPELVLSEPTPFPCAAYEPYAITHHSQQINRIDTPGGVPDVQPASWFIIAAWTEEKEFCGVQMGINDYDPAIFDFTWYGACCPATGCLEVGCCPWPEPNEGVAIVVTGDPWFGDYVPIYWFLGYAYGDAGPGIMQLIPDPTVVDPFAGFGNCDSPPTKWDAVLGGMGINMDGTYVAPTAVCCIYPGCFLTTDEQCLGAGGEWLPEVTSCNPSPCPPSAAVGQSWGRIKNSYR